MPSPASPTHIMTMRTTMPMRQGTLIRIIMATVIIMGMITATTIATTKAGIIMVWVPLA